MEKRRTNFSIPNFIFLQCKTKIGALWNFEYTLLTKIIMKYKL